jgi:DNA-directed RNA polymerase specialized sigma24 family protein
MSRRTTITKDKFDKTLAWLDQDRETAGQIYEAIRRSLIKILTWRGCNNAEDLADEAVNIVVQKIDELADSYTGKPALYFYGVARKLMSEHRRLERLRAALPEIGIDETRVREQIDRAELLDECLSHCLRELEPDEAQLVLDYYRGNKREKIDNRKGLAQGGDVAPNTLRVRVHRIRARLERCIKRRLEQD